MAKEYIEREALLAEYDRQHTGEPGRARKLIEDAPAADVVEVVHGRWKKKWHDNDLIGHEYEECSVCGCMISDTEKFWDCNYCPNCGAHMKDGE